MRQSRYTLSVIAAGILWGIISIFIKGLNASDLSPIQILQLRAIIASVIMAPYLFITDKKLLYFNIKDIWMFIGTGVISLTFFSLCYFQTIIESGASVAVILLYTSPIFVILFSLALFKEKITAVKLTALVMTFMGCILVSGLGQNGGGITVKGFIIGLGSGLGYALYSIFSRYALRKYHVLTITFYTFLFCGLSIIPFSGLGLGSGIMQPQLLLYGAGIALFCTVLPYLFYTYGMLRIETGKAAILVTVEPLVGTLVGCGLYGEPMTLLKAIGILLTFGAVILLGLKK
ncbi:MAG: EamA family transporter [Spirochaetia bacterium]|nr:EamA family transporter [Spirochaetia bacterium]